VQWKVIGGMAEDTAQSSDLQPWLQQIPGMAAKHLTHVFLQASIIPDLVVIAGSVLRTEASNSSDAPLAGAGRTCLVESRGTVFIL